MRIATQQLNGPFNFADNDFSREIAAKLVNSFVEEQHPRHWDRYLSLEAEASGSLGPV